MKIILSTPNFSPKDITNLSYNKETSQVSFSYKNKAYTAIVESPLGCYVKVTEDDTLEIISSEAIV